MERVARDSYLNSLSADNASFSVNQDFFFPILFIYGSFA